jgi:capping protein beta
MAEGDKLDYALDLMRRLPPSQIEKNLAGLIDLVPDLVEDLLSAVDQPLKIAFDAESKRDYLLCDYNRDGDSYRSPWTNKYDPPLHDGKVPKPSTRALEEQFHNAFNIYRDLYFEGGVSSVYLWDTDDAFAGVVVVKKTQDQTKSGNPMKGLWDSIHVFNVEEKGGSADYQLTSTIMLSIETNEEKTGMINLSGSLTRQESRDAQPVTKEKTHLMNVGSFIEDLENKMRASLDTIYFSKTKDIVNDLRIALGVQATQKIKENQGLVAKGAAAKKKT